MRSNEFNCDGESCLVYRNLHKWLESLLTSVSQILRKLTNWCVIRVVINTIISCHQSKKWYIEKLLVTKNQSLNVTVFNVAYSMSTVVKAAYVIHPTTPASNGSCIFLPVPYCNYLTNRKNGDLLINIHFRNFKKIK